MSITNPDDLSSIADQKKSPANADTNKRHSAAVKNNLDRCSCPSDENLPKSLSESNLSMMSPLRKSMLVSTLPMKEHWTCLKIKMFIKTFSVIFISDLKSEGLERWEVASLVCDNIIVDATQTDVSTKKTGRR